MRRAAADGRDPAALDATVSGHRPRARVHATDGLPRAVVLRDAHATTAACATGRPADGATGRRTRPTPTSTRPLGAECAAGTLHQLRHLLGWSALARGRSPSRVAVRLTFIAPGRPPRARHFAAHGSGVKLPLGAPAERTAPIPLPVAGDRRDAAIAVVGAHLAGCR